MAQALESSRIHKVIRVRGTFGKYRVERRLAEGGFASVYQARDTVAGIRVALKVLHSAWVTKDLLDAFRREVRLTAQLDHPNILPVRDAGSVDGVFYVATPLGIETLADRLGRRLATHTMREFASQMLAATAYAHRKRIMHCDIKPENFILFPENRLRLADFGIARVALRTMRASGSGTVGYVAPEQAMGKPSLRSDVFALGLVLYRMFSGCLPSWPYRWPMAGYDRIQRSLHPDMVKLLRRALEVQSGKRFADAVVMQRAFERVRKRAIRRTVSRRKSKTPSTVTWRTVRWREFTRRYGRILATRQECSRCKGPMAETMQACPWCGVKRASRQQPTRYPKRCPRCCRGVKSDWRFCPWCYGPSINRDGYPRYSDAEYTASCANHGCIGKQLICFMRYCPWCWRRVQRPWRIKGETDRCPKCKWGVLPAFWDYCPWCTKRIAARTT